MRGSIAILGSCLKLLAMVEAISLGKVSMSNYDVTWAQLDSSRLPVENSAYLFKNPPSYADYNPQHLLEQLAQTNNDKNTRETSIDDVPQQQTMLDAPSQHTDGEVFSYSYDFPTKNVVAKNSVDDSQKNPDPYLKLKLKLKVKLPQSAQTKETMMPKPEDHTLVEEELIPSQLSDDNPESGSNDDPLAQYFEKINSHTKYFPVSPKVEQLKHTSRTPVKMEIASTPELEVEEIPQQAPLAQNDYELETTRIDAYLKYLDKVQLLVDRLQELREIQEQPSTESVESQAKILGTNLGYGETQPSLEDGYSQSKVPLQTSRNSPSASLSKDKLETGMKLPDFEDTPSEDKPSDPLTKGVNKNPMQLFDTASFESEPPKYLVAEQNGNIHKESEIPHNGDPSTTIQPSKDIQGGQMKIELPEPIKTQSGPEEKDPSARLYDDIYKFSKGTQTVENIPTFSQVEERDPFDQEQNSNPKLYEKIYGAARKPSRLDEDVRTISRLSKEQIMKSPTFQPSKDIKGDQMKIELPEPIKPKSGPEEQDLSARLYDDIYKFSKATQTVESIPTFSQVEERDPFDQEQNSDLKLYEKIYGAARKPSRSDEDAQTISRLLEEKSKEQIMKSQTFEVIENQPKTDPNANMSGELSKTWHPPLQFSGSVPESDKTSNPNNHVAPVRDTMVNTETEGLPPKNIISQLFSWMQ